MTNPQRNISFSFIIILWACVSPGLVRYTSGQDYGHYVAPLVSPKVYEVGEDHHEEIHPEPDEKDKTAPINWDEDHIAKERDHIQEHIDLPYVDTSQMNGDELQFHYFRMYDADKDNYLDGCELIKNENQQYESVHEGVDGHESSSSTTTTSSPVTPKEKEEKIWSDQELENIIDPLLQRHDKNGDGLIDYAEFKSYYL